MGLTHMKIKELLDEGRQHECDGVGTEHACVHIAAIAATGMHPTNSSA